MGDGYLLYVTSSGMLENDELTVIINKDGSIRHFTTNDVKIWFNATYQIGKNPEHADMPF